ncbi:MAG TPA: DUF6709 family protein [Phototrophicaceae bacterium]|jgi:hypothetical protein|nr:DUF6709 family protein [Phototrophicaceae bacterium]
MEHRIGQVVRRSNLNRFLTGIITFAIIAAIVVVSLRYYANFFNGPTEVSFAQLLDVPSDTLKDWDWVTVEGDETVDTGYQYINTSSSGSETVENSYAALWMEDHLLLVKLQGEIKDEDDLPTTFSGALTSIPSDVQREVMDEILDDEPDLKDVFFPLMLDTDDYRRGGFLGFVGLGVLLIFSGFMLITVFRRIGSPESHPIMKGLSRFGHLDSVIPQLESELNTEHPIVGKFHFTRNWVVQKTVANLQAVPYQDVVWVYQKTTRQRVNGVPAGRRFSLMLNDRYGKLIEYQTKEKIVQEIMQNIAQRAPWAVVGYSDEIEKIWRTDRAKFVASVDQRKSSSRASTGTPTGAPTQAYG